MGSKENANDAQEIAKNLISESIAFFESTGDVKSVAMARVELAYCYWREGALDEARVLLREALAKLATEGNTRARALLRLAIVECSDSRYETASSILSDHARLFGKITNHAIRGAYHNQVAMVLRKLATPENRTDCLRQAIREYQEADVHFKLAHNIPFRANVKNNVGNVLRQMSRFKEAHKYLLDGRNLMSRVRDRVGTAQIDDTRAQVLIAERKFKEAERVARGAVAILEKSGHQCLLADALITHGVAMARLGQADRARFIFERAIDVAHQVGALNKAGLAALTLIEELDQASTEILGIAFDRASEWLADSQSEELWRRLNSAARKVFMKLHGEIDAQQATETLLNRPRNLQSQVLNYEGNLIRHALARTNGRLTQAASLLGMSYQGLAYVIASRHKDLLKERSPVRPRTRRG